MKINDLLKLYPTEEEEKDIVNMIESVVVMNFDDFRNVFNENRDIFSKKFVQWWMIMKKYPTLSIKYNKTIRKEWRKRRAYEFWN